MLPSEEPSPAAAGDAGARDAFSDVMAQLAAASAEAEFAEGYHGRHHCAVQDRGLDARQQMIDALKVQLSKPRTRHTMESA